MIQDVGLEHRVDAYKWLRDVSTITVSNAAAQVIRYAVSEPNDCEVCGFLLGDVSGECLRIEAAQPAVNIYQSKTSFAISQNQYAAVLRETNPPLRVAGIYHLHFGSAHLSLADRRNIVLHSFVWLIIGITGSTPSQALDWRCFSATERGIRRIRVGVELDVKRTGGAPFLRAPFA